jgi:hypothetical protein
MRRLLFVTLILASFMIAANSAHALEDERTANRTPEGNIIYPDWMFSKPEHYEFLPLVSNHDPKNQHPQQWDGQDWEPAAWNSQQWTPEIVIRNLYANGTFYKQYTRGKSKMPVLEVGPTFFKLSDLDRRRSLKLLAEQSQVFERGHAMIELRDWRTREVVGDYTKAGMHLN